MAKMADLYSELSLMQSYENKFNLAAYNWVRDMKINQGKVPNPDLSQKVEETFNALFKQQEKVRGMEDERAREIQ